MKKNAIFRFGIIATLLVIFSGSLRSQPPTPSCNYRVENHMSCPINVTVEFFNPTSCKTIGPTPIAAGSAQMFNCSGCTTPLGNVKVTLNSVNGSAVASPNSITGPPANVATGGYTPCNGAGHADLKWNYGVTTVDPTP